MNKKERRKRAAIYREAARLIEERQQTFSCYAICEASGVEFDDPLMRYQYPYDTSAAKSYPPRVAYIAVYSADGTEDRLSADFDDGGSPYSHGMGSHRATALCLMAAMVEAGDA